MVYVREAHPVDEWRMSDNDDAGWSLAQPRTPGARRAAAAEFAGRLHLSMPLLVDDIDDSVSIPWGAWPDRLYLLDAAGRVLYRSEVGPFGFRPGLKELRERLGSLRP